MDEKVFLSVADVAKTLSLGVTYTRRLINSGAIKSVRVGKRVLVPRQYLDEYVSMLIAANQNALEVRNGKCIHPEAGAQGRRRLRGIGGSGQRPDHRQTTRAVGDLPYQA